MYIETQNQGAGRCSQGTEITDNEYVLSLLQSGAKLTCFDTTFNSPRCIMNLRSRICDLKEQGYKIHTAMITLKKDSGRNARVAQYSM